MKTQTRPDCVRSTAEISRDGVYRYRLCRQWKFGLPLLGWTMLNPSVADASEDDPTIRRCMDFAYGWGYGGIVVVNLFALRATNPQRLRTHPDPVGEYNDSHLDMAAFEVAQMICAWGAHPLADRWAAKVIGIIRKYRSCSEVRCLELTQGGYPRHPLYVRKDVCSIPFADGA